MDEMSEQVCTLYLSSLMENIIYELTNVQTTDISIIKINHERIQENGELCFVTSTKAWRRYLNAEDLKFKTIFEYYLHRKNKLKKDETKENIENEAVTDLITVSKDWFLRISKCYVCNDRAYIFLNRVNLITKVLKITVEQDHHYGSNYSQSKSFNIKFDEMEKSSLTQKRLELMKDATINILKSQGHKICDDDTLCNNYIFTAKSQGQCLKNYNKYVVGVAKTDIVKEEDDTSTWEKYYRLKSNSLAEISKQKCIYSDYEIGSDNLLRDITNAVIFFEMLKIKPSRIVVLNCNNSIGDTKGATFILYNAARISAICQKYKEKQKCGEYPELLNMDGIDFSLLNQEEEWKLIYSFILMYPEMLCNTVQFEPNFKVCPYHICSFLQSMCQTFSTYYRQNRILLKGYPHLLPTMMARMYLLKAVEIILRNGMQLLNLNLVKYM